MYNPLDLYGGREAVLSSMNEVYKNRLLDITLRVVKQIAKELHKPLEEIEATLDYRELKKIKGIMGVTLDQFLGKPTFRTPEEKAYWEQQRGTQCLPNMGLTTYLKFQALKELDND